MQTKADIKFPVGLKSSLFGLVALAGVVVNDSIIMVDFINKARQEGMDIIQAVVNSGTQRFRAIILTSLTTAIGLMPIMTETSTQAQFVIPMAISIAFGIVFATWGAGSGPTRRNRRLEGRGRDEANPENQHRGPNRGKHTRKYENV